MKIAVFGCGYVGLTNVVGLAKLGHSVIGVEIDLERLKLLQKGKCPFYEPKIEQLLRENLRSKRINFTADGAYAIENSDAIFCAVGTPKNSFDYTDTSAVEAVVKLFLNCGKTGQIFVNKSTVPVGVNKNFANQLIHKKTQYYYHPEFLREGTALQDFLKPDRMIVGFEKNLLEAKKFFQKLYVRRIVTKIPFVYCDFQSAEIIKYAANAFLAMRLSYINEMADFAEAAGAKIDLITRGIGLDPRIGMTFLNSGIGFGGSCLPKDLASLISQGEKFRVPFKILPAIQAVNQERPKKYVELLRKNLGGLRNKKIAIWGLAYKPDTDDMRDAPAAAVIKLLLKAGAKIVTHDPKANLKAFKSSISDQYKAAAGADALMVLTEWNEYLKPDWEKLARAMKGNAIVDCRNIYNAKVLQNNGFFSLGIGT